MQNTLKTITLPTCKFGLKLNATGTGERGKMSDGLGLREKCLESSVKSLGSRVKN